ncbi:hypothetical protein A2333_01975 [Candidatus Wolfebacteria bacterium RIFOXYB2_FULL_49_7]|nr:MAG: hypothetical protein A2333_01975 [Candidatus Wolfebacteria bacterium RIFOXYB2_FULL_49_7]
MIKKIKQIIRKNSAPETDFSRFFYTASSGEKKKVMKQVIREANKDQKDMIKRYERKVKEA